MTEDEYKFMCEDKRFVYVRGKYRHGIHDTEKDGKYRRGYRTTYDDFDLDKITILLNQLLEEKEKYQHLWDEMSYYFRDDVKLEDLDHKDFHSLQRLSKGLVD